MRNQHTQGRVTTLLASLTVASLLVGTPVAAYADESPPTSATEATASSEPAEPSAEEEPPANDSAASSSYESDASLNSPNVSVVVPADACAAAGLPVSCGLTLDTGGVEYLAQALVTGCTAPSGTCTAAITAARGALGVAAACIEALDLGVSAAELASSGLPGVGVTLDCRQAARTAADTAQKVMVALGECTSAQTDACARVYDAVALATDRALGCVLGALAQAGIDSTIVGGTDLGCGNAVYALQGTATMLAGLVQNCKDGTGFCATLTQVAEFLGRELRGCVDALVVNVQYGYVAPPFPASGGLYCYQVLDQANVWLEGVSSLRPSIPYRFSPTTDCTLTLPGAPGTVGMPTGLLIPPCTPPMLTPAFRTPAPPPGARLPGEGEMCEYKTWVEPTANYAPIYTEKDRPAHHNRSTTRTVRWVEEYSKGLDDTWSWRVAVEAEANMLFIKAKDKVEYDLQKSTHHDWSTTIDMAVAPNHVGFVSFGFAKWQQEGNVYEKFEDCSTSPAKRIILFAPYDRSSWSDQSPYQQP